MKKTKNYFDEETVTKQILEWQEDRKCLLELEEKNLNNTKEYFLLKQKVDKELSTIMESVYKVIKGVIFRARFQKRERFDTCFQIATEACIKSLPRFNPEFGTSFNYLSLTAKRSIIYYLIKKSKKKHLSLDYEYMDEEGLKLEALIKQEEISLKNLEIDNLVDTILNLIETQKANKNLIKVTEEFKDYLFYNKGKYDKRDFFEWARSDGINSNLLRKFIKFLKQNKDILYNEIGVY